MWPTNHVPDDSTDKWSTPFGVWLGVPVRLHVSVMMLLAVLAWGVFQSGSFVLGLAAIVYLFSIIGHEVAHAFAAWRVEGDVEALVLGPNGGVRPPLLPEDPEARVFVAMAGPLFHLAAVLLGAICLSTHEEPLLTMLWPSRDLNSLSVDTPAILLAELTIWINGPLFLLNMLPAFPFDGGEAIRALLWPWFGRATSNQIVYRFAMLTSAALLVSATMVVTPVTPWAWPGVGLVALSVLVLFGANRDNQSHTESNWIRGQGPHMLAEHDPSDSSWWEGEEGRMVLVELKQHQLAADSEEQTISEADESYEDQRVDDILAKLHEKGFDQLSQPEKELLERASKRYRRRHSE